MKSVGLKCRVGGKSVYLYFIPATVMIGLVYSICTEWTAGIISYKVRHFLSQIWDTYGILCERANTFNSVTYGCVWIVFRQSMKESVLESTLHLCGFKARINVLFLSHNFKENGGWVRNRSKSERLDKSTRCTVALYVKPLAPYTFTKTTGPFRNCCDNSLYSTEWSMYQPVVYVSLFMICLLSPGGKSLFTLFMPRTARIS